MKHSLPLLRLLDGLLSISRFLLVIVTVMFVLISAFSVFQSTSVDLSGTTDRIAIQQTLPDGSVALHHVSSQTTEWQSAPGADGARIPDIDARFGSADVSVPVEDRTLRVFARFVIAAWLGLAWIAVTNVRSVTRSALDGTTFTMANATRLRRTGGAALGYAAMLVAVPILMGLLVDRLTLSVEGFEPESGGDSAWLWLIVGLLLVAVGEAFERGVELQELEQATI
jgi:hypothetical protein